MGTKTFAVLILARLASNFLAWRTFGSSGPSEKAQDTSVHGREVPRASLEATAPGSLSGTGEKQRPLRDLWSPLSVHRRTRGRHLRAQTPPMLPPSRSRISLLPEYTIESLDKSLEDLLTRVDEFVAMLDMIRSDSSQVVNESLPQIYTKATEMRHIYRKIDKLETFVKMVGNSVAGLEERVIKAETDFGAFPSTFKKLLHTISIPSFINKSSSSRQQTLYEPPVLFKTEDYFPCLNEAPY
ncbi:PREDICTED: biogenesis of lysosome-related organelles complex 1 subunit 4-like [Mesitornis unicolor]|uniref:biogenesis of lysosome-related organelles complex 1 subunit 4-like n=1 Tax=Mesitornis unicolor TaxID=54374 RepID=UPI00052832E4|nr:PREDICTED: biogenesis of lysosome-related organelles complex 1 subunit 4-like [Mesitornis unicolor]